MPHTPPRPPHSLWPAPVAGSPVTATVRIPGSKSMTNRALILSALAEGTSTITGALISRDTQLMMDALRTLGVEIEVDGTTVRVTAPASLGGGHVDCGLAGTVMRFVPPVAALATQPVSFDGDAAARRRPMATTLESLRCLGVRVAPADAAEGTATPGAAAGATADAESPSSGAAPADAGDSPEVTALPFALLPSPRPTADSSRGATTAETTGGAAATGGASAAPAVAGGEVHIDASASSQFVSGLLLAGARYRDGVTVVHTGTALPSQPHVEMSVQMLREAGVQVDVSFNRWHVHPGPIAARTWHIEPDLSNATPFLAAAAITDGEVRIPDWPLTTTQPGDQFRDILRDMGAHAEYHAHTGELAVTGPADGRSLNGITWDMHDIGELTPTVAALAALADSRSHLYGIAHLRGHETDRLSALARNLNALGGQVTQTDDGLIIDPSPLHGGVWESYEDHRMATAGAILGLVIPGIEVEDIGTTAKTLPDFAGLWTKLVEG